MPKLLRTILILAALIAATLALYWPVGRHDFVSYDDPLYVTDNPIVQRGLTAEGVKWAFTTIHASNWHPLTWLSHMADCQVFGQKPAGPHWVNLALHAINACLLLLLWRRMTGDFWIGAFIAFAFALHPLRIESVAWISERKDVLSTMFGLLAIRGYVSFATRRSAMGYALMLAAFALSLMAKPMLVTLPFVLLLLDFWPLKRIGATVQPADGVGGVKPDVETGPGWSPAIARRLVLEKIPLFALSAGSCVMTFIAQHAGGSVESLDVLPLGARAANAIVSYGRYLNKTIWPLDLAVMYPYPSAWPWLTVLGTGAILVLVTAIFVIARRRHPYLLVGWLWFLGTLLPVIGLVQVGAQSMADRYAYVPQIGVLMVIAYGAAAVIGRERSPLLWIASLMSLAALWMVGSVQVRTWSGSAALYEHAIKTVPGNWLAHNNLGKLLMDQGQIRAAAPHFAAAAEARPTDPDLLFNLADAQYRLGDTDAAAQGFARVLQIDRQYVQALNGLAWLLATHPDPNRRNGAVAVDLAEQLCRISKNRDPGHLDTLAAAYAEAGKFPAAIITADQARTLAAAAGNHALEAEIAGHIELFKAQRPLHQ